MNYKVISDFTKLREFVRWLPWLSQDEKFYMCLFARKKYCDKILSSDKTQLKRVLVTKENMIAKIRQMECTVGSYQLKEGAVPQESLVLYISPNPRDMRRATYDSIIRLTTMLKNNNTGFNVHQEVMSTIQKTKSTTHFVDFDFDDPDENLLTNVRKVVNKEALTIVQTRGGYHCLVSPSSVEEKYKRTWYNDIKNLGADQSGDTLLPVVGCVQGGFTPKFIK